MSDAPERIYLQTWMDEVTWCADMIDGPGIGERDVEYVRADFYTAMQDKRDRLRDGLSWIARRGYPGASHVARELLNGKVYPPDPRTVLDGGE